MFLYNILKDKTADFLSFSIKNTGWLLHEEFGHVSLFRNDFKVLINKNPALESNFSQQCVMWLAPYVYRRTGRFWKTI